MDAMLGEDEGSGGFNAFANQMGARMVTDGLHAGGIQTLPTRQKRMGPRQLSNGTVDGIHERVRMLSDDLPAAVTGTAVTGTGIRGLGAGVPFPYTPDYAGSTAPDYAGAVPLPSVPDYDGDTSAFGDGTASSHAASEEFYDVAPPKRESPPPPSLGGGGGRTPVPRQHTNHYSGPEHRPVVSEDGSGAEDLYALPPSRQNIGDDAGDDAGAGYGAGAGAGAGGYGSAADSGSPRMPRGPVPPYTPPTQSQIVFPDAASGSQAFRAEQVLLPPPKEVQNILCGKMVMLSQFDGNRAAWKRNQFDPVVHWLLDAVAAAHLSTQVKLLARRVLAYGGFTRNLCAANSVNAITGILHTSFDEFITGLQEIRTKLGEQMHQIYISRKLGEALSESQLAPLLRVHRCFVGNVREEVRQDADGVLANLGGYFEEGVVDYDDPVAYSERKLMHVLVMTCAAVNSIFQDALQQACGRHAVWTKGGPLKKVARMLNKMLADDRNELKPRCMMQIDVIRSMVAVKTPEELKHVLRALSGSFGGGFAYSKNLFAISEEKAAKRKHLRSVMVTVLYEPNGAMTFGELVKRSETTKVWDEHEKCPSGEPSERWEMLTNFARQYLTGPDMVARPVRVLCEVQILIESYVPIREATNEVYKAARCESADKLNAQFVQALDEMQGAKTKVLLDNLGTAARAGQARTLESMLKRGDNPNEDWGRGRTAAYLAAEKGHTDVVSVLSQYGADFNLGTDLGLTPLAVAAQRGHVGALRVLIAQGADLNIDCPETPLLTACIDGLEDVAEMLVVNGANAELPAVDPKWEGQYPLHAAVLKKHQKIVKLLAAHGANVDSTMDRHLTPLGLAAELGYDEAARTLIESGADINWKNAQGDTPLSIASEHGHAKLVEYLADTKGCDLNAVGSDGSTAILLACRNQHLDVVQILAERGAELRHALQAAIQGGMQDVSSILISYVGNVTHARVDQPVERGHGLGVRATSFQSGLHRGRRAEGGGGGCVTSSSGHAAHVRASEPVLATPVARPRPRPSPRKGLPRSRVLSDDDHMDFGFPVDDAPERLSASPPLVAASARSRPAPAWPWQDRGCLKGCLNPEEGRHHTKCPNYLGPGGSIAVRDGRRIGVLAGGPSAARGGSRRMGVLETTWPGKDRGCLRGCINPEKNKHHVKCPNFAAPSGAGAASTHPTAPTKTPSALLAAALAPGTAAAAARASVATQKSVPAWAFKEVGCLRACVDPAQGLHHRKCPNYGVMLGTAHGSGGGAQGAGGEEGGDALPPPTPTPTPRPRPRPRPRPT